MERPQASPTAFPTRSDLPLHQELHARPALPARAPCVVSYWALADMASERADAALLALSRWVGAPDPLPGQRHARVPGPGWELKFERHGEFVSWQLNRPLSGWTWPQDPLQARTALQQVGSLDDLPQALLAEFQQPDAGRLIAATHVLMLAARGDDELLGQCREALRDGGGGAGDDSAPLMGAFIGDARNAALLTQLQLGPDGFTRFVVLDFGLPRDQAAREAQRLCEIEAYRMLAMLGFPLAQQESQRLDALEQRLQAAVHALAHEPDTDDAAAFAELTALAAEVEHASARSGYRFSATRAYHALVRQRLDDLREQRMMGVQTLSGFLSRRFAPAMAYCESTERRLGALGERINRAVNLARVRIEAQREQGNQELLRALATRQQAQLKLQQTVEGLSVVAISYYALGLVGYGAKALGKLPGLPAWWPSADALVALAVLPVLAAVAWGLRRLRHGE